MKIVLTITLIATLCVSVVMLGSPTPSPVADAAMKGNIDSVRSLLKDGADVNAPQADGMTALHWAAEHGNAQLADMLLYAFLDFGTQVGQPINTDNKNIAAWFERAKTRPSVAATA